MSTSQSWEGISNWKKKILPCFYFLSFYNMRFWQNLAEKPDYPSCGIQSENMPLSSLIRVV